MERRRYRIVESPSGKGKVYEGEEFLCAAAYKLQVFQETVTSTSFGETSSVEGDREIKGSLSGCDFYLLFGKELLTLHLRDGRRLNFFLKNSRGQIVASGDFQQS